MGDLVYLRPQRPPETPAAAPQDRSALKGFFVIVALLAAFPCPLLALAAFVVALAV